MSNASVLTSISLSEQIRNVLLQRIICGELKPGDRLIELKIAADMATSQAPVREAIRELQTMGVIESMRNKGSRVRVITNEEIVQIYDVRAQLEAYATRLTTETGAPVKTSLKQILRTMKKVARAGDSLEFASQNSEFHFTIVEAAGNNVLLEHWEKLNVQTRTMLNVSRSSRNLTELAASHEVIIDAISAGNAQKAYKIAIDHVLSNKPDL